MKPSRIAEAKVYTIDCGAKMLQQIIYQQKTNHKPPHSIFMCFATETSTLTLNIFRDGQAVIKMGHLPINIIDLINMQIGTLTQGFQM